MKVNGRPRSFGPARFSLTMTLKESFDAIDHKIIIYQKLAKYEVDQEALKWASNFKWSYLTDRMQRRGLVTDP